MRKLCILLFCLAITSSFAYQVPDKIDQRKNYYKIAMKAWRRKQKVKAINNMRLAFFQKKNSYRLFWLSNFLVRSKKYKAHIKLLSHIPKKFWYPCPYGTAIYRHYALALRKMQKYQKAAKILLKALAIKSSKDRGKNLRPLILYWYQFPYLTLEFKKHPEYRKILMNTLKFFDKNWHRHKYITYNLFDFLIVAAVDELFNNRKKLAFYLINTSIKIARLNHHKRDKSRVKYALFIKRAMRYWLKNIKQKQMKAYPFKILGLYFDRVAARLKNPRTKKIYFRKNKMSPLFIKRMMAEFKENFKVAKLVYFYFTQGHFLLSFTYKHVKATIKEVTKGRFSMPIMDMTFPHPGKIFYKTFNKFDAYFKFYDVKIPSAFLGGRGHIMFIPYTLYSRYWRPKAWLSSGTGYGVIIHELFHGFEGYFKIRPSHGYVLKTKSRWKPWYRKMYRKFGTTSELDYYFECFKRYMLPGNRLKELHYRRLYPTLIKPELFKKFQRLFSRYSFWKVKKSRKLLLKAVKLRKRRQYKKAIRLLKKALRLFKYNHQALAFLGLLYHWNVKQPGKSLTTFLKYLKYFSGLPYTEMALIYALWTIRWHKKNYQLMLKLIRKHSKYVVSKVNKMKLMYYKAIGYGETGRKKIAVKLLKKVMAHKSRWLRKTIKWSIKHYSR